MPERGRLYVVPNPATDRTTLHYFSAAKTTSTINIFDMRGLLRERRIVSTEPGLNTYSLDLLKLEQGIFTIIVSNEFEVLEKRLDKQ